jgi:hypothetical protein
VQRVEVVWKPLQDFFIETFRVSQFSLLMER